MKYGTPTWTPTPEQRLRMRKEAAAAARRLAKKNGIVTTDDCLKDPALLRKYMRTIKEKYKTEAERIPRLRDVLGMPRELL
ncbi:MAG: hypothetical protein ABI972_26325 [Acidobacteriota bacterium]